MSRDTRFRLIFVIGWVVLMVANTVIFQSNGAYHLFHNVYYQAAWVAMGTVLLLVIGALIVRMWLRQGFANIRRPILVGQFALLAFLVYGLIQDIHNLG